MMTEKIRLRMKRKKCGSGQGVARKLNHGEENKEI